MGGAKGGRGRGGGGGEVLLDMLLLGFADFPSLLHNIAIRQVSRSATSDSTPRCNRARITIQRAGIQSTLHATVTHIIIIVHELKAIMDVG